MTDRIASLTEREQEVLRLLLAGHTAKSAASALDLSVHTINDYLREARKKLGVGSSKEAARLLSDHDATHKNLGPENLGPHNPDPQNLGPQQIGMGEGGSAKHIAITNPKQTSHRAKIAWVIGGIAMLSIIAAIAVVTMSGSHPVNADGTEVELSATDKALERDALDWIKLIDEGDYAASWNAAGTTFQEGVTAEKWAEMADQVRAPLGTVSTRSLKAVTVQKDVPNAPKGDYRFVQFDTKYTNSPYVLESVIMYDEGGSWKVVGYFIR